MESITQTLVSTYGLAGIVIVMLSSVVIALWKHNNVKAQESRGIEEKRIDKLEHLTENGIGALHAVKDEINKINATVDDLRELNRTLFQIITEQSQTNAEINLKLSQCIERKEGVS